MTDQTSAAPEHDHDAEPSARELDEQERGRARMANERDWSAIASSAAQTALANVVAALAPIAENREACKRVIDAAERLFVPVAIAPRKEIDEILTEIAGGPLGQIGFRLVERYLAAQAQPKKAPCNCGPGIQAQRVYRPAPVKPVPTEASGPPCVIVRMDIDAFLGADGGTWVQRAGIQPTDERIAQYAGTNIGLAIAETFRGEPFFEHVRLAPIA